MGKLDVKEVRGQARDPRSEAEDALPTSSAVQGRVGPPVSSGVGPRGGASRGELDLSLDLGAPAPAVPPPPPQKKPSGAPDRPDGGRDSFQLLGTNLADTFQIESVVAHGGFAVVYRAHHLRFAAPVAVKCLKIPTNLNASERKDFLDRFQKEGEVMFRLSSSIPEIVRPLQYDSFKMPDGRLVPFIVLEWLEGQTLKDEIVSRLAASKPPMSFREGVEFLTPVARALGRAHRCPSPDGPLCILHCDLKPDNIFVTQNGGGESLRIFDFGISKVRNAATRQVGGSTVDAAGSMFTPAYAAPEQWTPDRWGQTGPWTDVFSLALTLTEVITQRPAIDGPPAAMFAQAINPKDRPTPRRLGLAVHDSVDEVFRKALAVDPRERFQDIATFWDALEALIGVRSSSAGPRSSLSAVARAEMDGGPPLAQPPMPELGGLSFSGELDLPPPAPKQVPKAAPSSPASFQTPPGLAAQLQGAPLPLGELESAPSPAQNKSEPPNAGFGASLDLAAEPERPAPRPMPPMAPLSNPGMGPHSVPTPQGSQPHWAPPPQDSYPGQMMPEGPPSQSALATPVPTKERLQAAASKAGQVATQVATVAAVSAAHAAKSIATRALEVDKRHRISLEQPSTWIKPMMGPILAMAAALLVSVVAVIVNKAMGSNVRVMWISLPLMLAAIGFAIYRWMKITKE